MRQRLARREKRPTMSVKPLFGQMRNLAASTRNLGTKAYGISSSRRMRTSSRHKPLSMLGCLPCCVSLTCIRSKLNVGLQIYEDFVDGVIERVSEKSEWNLPDLRTHIRKRFNHAQAAQGKDLSLAVICWAVSCCFLHTCNVLAVLSSNQSKEPLPCSPSRCALLCRHPFH